MWSAHPRDVSLRLAYLRILTELSQHHQANNQYPEAIAFAESDHVGTAELPADVREPARCPSLRTPTSASPLIVEWRTGTPKR
ncbi:MAG: hypothetical protein IPM21_12035 [Acidobacteria bacterium]|nr:hypothetical protein [Acidobacteriota bacterium]